MSLEWHRLRPWNGSQRHAFEELCCQIAARAPAPLDSSFTRIGAPDAGVECIRTLASGEVWGWQAKFFLSPPTSGQWTEIDASVRQALDHYPTLVRYTVCLPIDRADARIPGRVSFMDRWNTRVQKWSGWASGAGRTVQFDYWGEHEILEALARREHAGRARFWFNREILDRPWLDAHLERALEDAGPRYSRKLNVQLDISEVFDGLERNKRYIERLLAFWTAVRKEFDSVDSPALRAAQLKSFETLSTEVGVLRTLVLSVHDAAPTDPLPTDLLPVAARVSSATWDCERDVERLASEARTKAREEGTKPIKPGDLPQEPAFQSEDYHLRMLGSRIRDLREFLQGPATRAARVGALLLEGEAGTGKTHLFCDVGRRAVAEGRVAVVLLGEKFTRDEPWSQIARQLGLPDNGADEVLGTFSAAAEASGKKALLLIDALNEGDGRALWPRYLAGLLAAVRRYPWVAIAVSVRRSYTPVVIPQNLDDDRLVRVEHPGFRQAEVRATRAFFDFYRIERPSVPVLTPEFSNPLFLTLFCKGLWNAGLRRIPEGLEGISAVFGFFVSSVDDKLSREEQLGFDPQAHLVDRAISALARIMVDERLRWIPRDRAQATVNALLPRDRYEQTLFRGLLVEGVLSEEIFFTREGEQVQGVRFTYERFADHRIAQYLLAQHLDPADFSKTFEPEAPLAGLAKDLGSAWRNRGIIEAFSIQLPERIGRELIEVFPQAAKHEPVWLAFLESLIWRRPESIGDVGRKLVEKNIARDPAISAELLDVLLTVASNPRHPLNAEFLHARLMRDSLPERDAWWSTYLFRSYGQHGAVDRMVDWALTAGAQPHYSESSVELCSVALAWFLTTSHRFVRDRATKGLVMLLQNRVGVLRRLLERFQAVNDPYVRERLYAVAYGCALRTTDHASIEGLARDVFAQIFQSGSPPPHILLRDYARGVIEVAAHRSLVQDFDLALIRPPYRTAPPDEPPTEEELRTRYSPDTDFSHRDLWGSVMSYGDFERYIIGTNSHSFEFTRRPLTTPWIPPQRVRYRQFADGIPKRAQGTWQTLQTVREAARNLRYKRPIGWPLNDWIAKLPEGTNIAKVLDAGETALETSLYKEIGKKRRAEYEAVWKVYDPHAADPDLWDLESAKRWIFNRVIELGWTPERFGEFDDEVDEKGRSAHKPERIGKKYQWLAYHEYLARVADNFEFRPDSWGDDEQKYDGPWQGMWRDIDPSVLSSTIPRDREPTRREDWNPVTYDAWRLDVDDETWLANKTDLPTPSEFLRWTDPRDGARWLLMDGSFVWEKQLLPDSEPHSGPRRRVQMKVCAYIIRAKDLDRVRAWSDGRNFWGPGIPEGLDTTHVFLGEYPWAPAYTTQYGNGPKAARDRYGSPVRLITATDTYHWSGADYDCSIDEALNIDVPTARLLPKRQGIWPCERTQAMFINPGVSGGPHVLLARDPEWHERLRRRNRAVIWLAIGMKIVWSKYEPTVSRISGAIWPTDSEYESSLALVPDPPRNRR